MTNSIDDVARCADVIMLVGSNPEEAHPVIGMQLRAAVERGARLIVVDPRDIRLASEADIHLKLKPGTNVYFANAFANYLIQNDLYDEQFVADRTEGFEILAATVRDYTPEEVERVCGIDRRDFIAAVKTFAEADAAAIVYCLGVTEHSTGTDGVMALANVSMLTGNLGKRGAGMNPLRGQNNVQGACDMGAGPDDLPGYQKVWSNSAVEKFERAWGVPLSRRRGTKATDCYRLMGTGGIRGLLLVGEDPVRTEPDSHHVAEELSNLDLFVAVDLFLTESAKLADVVLPARAYAEKEGTFTNTERRVQRVRKAVDGPRGSWLDTDIFTEIMVRMGYPQPHLTSAEIFDEMASLTPSYAGMSHARLDSPEIGGRGLQWPCPTPKHPGTPILHMDGFSRGLGAFSTPEYAPSAELPDEDYPLVLMTGRVLSQYNACAMTGRTQGANDIDGSSFIEINSEDAARFGVADGDTVTVESRRGSIVSRARVSDKPRRGSTWMPFHFQDGNANVLTNGALDPVSKTPEFKVCAVRVTPVRA